MCICSDGEHRSTDDVFPHRNPEREVDLAAQQRKSDQQKLQEVFHRLHPLSRQVLNIQVFLNAIPRMYHNTPKHYKIIKIYLLSIKGKKTVHFYSKKRRFVSDTPLVTFNSSSRMDITAAVAIDRTLRATMRTFTVCRKSATSARHTWGSPRMCPCPFIRHWSRVPPVGTCSLTAIPQSCRQRM